MDTSNPAETRRVVMSEIRSRFPGFRQAVLADARVTAGYRGERHEFRSRLDALVQIIRLCVVSDAFLAHLLYRLKASLQRRGIPLLPRIAHRLAMIVAQVSIGDPVVLHPGVYIVHGQTIIDGLVEIHSGSIIGPWTSIGLKAGDYRGPTIGRDVFVGTGARVLGPWKVGAGAHIGANAVVTSDVDAGAIVVGAPARPLPR